jgi:iron complex outermembrane receptor protein
MGKLTVRSALLLGIALTLVPEITAFATEAETGELETVVVTAQKREENLQTVPVSVTALDSQTLASLRYENPRDLNAIAPGLTVRLEAGGVTGVNLTMRGIYGTATYGSESGVAVYTDGIYIASTRLQMDLADVERVEILRGPQGTLFGLNALAGAINVITREPSGEFHVRQELSAGNLSQFKSKTTVDSPKWGPLSASVTYLHEQWDGSVNNLGAGTVWHWGAATNGLYGDLDSPATLGENNTNAVAAAVKLETENGFKVVYRFNYSQRSYSPDAVGILSFNAGPGMALGYPLSSFSQSAWNNQPVNLRTPISLTRPDAVNNAFTTQGEENVQSSNLTVTAPIMEGVTIKDLFGYRHEHNEVTNELSGDGGLLTSYLPPYPGIVGFLQRLNAGPPGTPFITLGNASEGKATTLQNEVQLNADTRWVKATLGYLYYHNIDLEGGLPGSFNVAALSGLFAQPLINHTAYPFGQQQARVSSISSAGYTQDEVHITDKLDVDGGIRYTKDTREGTDTSAQPAGPATPISYDQGVRTYLGGLNYKVTNDIFTYAHYSTGYLAGGQLANVTFNPSFATSWEAGVKSDLFHKTLRVNTDVFLVKYTGVQTLTSPMTGCANVPGVAKGGAQCIINGGNARAYGLELEATYVTPVQGLVLNGNVGYTDFYYTEIDPALRAADGTFVPNYNPKWTAALGINYSGPDLNSLGGAHVLGRFDGTFSSRQYITTNEVFSVLDANQVPSTRLFNIRLGLGGFHVIGAEVEIAGYAKNLFDNKNLQYGTPLGLIVAGNYQPGRYYGVDLNARF